MRIHAGYASFVGLLGLVLLFFAATPAPAAAAPVSLPVAATAGNVVALAPGGDSIDDQIRGLTRGLMLQLRRYWRITKVIWTRASNWWGYWLRKAALPIGIVLLAMLADASLLNAFRLEGLRALATYVPLMLYVYLQLLFSGGVRLLPKLLLLGAIVYGAIRRDLLPDRTLVPGRVDDIILLVVATRAFVYACPEELVERYAARAVGLRSMWKRAQERAR